MRILNYILILFLITTSSCTAPVKKEVNDAHRIVREATREMKTSERQSDIYRVKHWSTIRDSLVKRIDSGSNKANISAKNQILTLYQQQIAGIDSLSNSLQDETVNAVFIEKQGGKHLRNNTMRLIDQTVQIFQSLNNPVKREDLRIHIKQDIGKPEQTWEE